MNCSAASIRISRAYFAARLALVVLLLLAGHAPVPAQGRRATPAQLEAARDYVRKGWRTLMRSNRDLAAAAVDPKFKPAGSASTHRWPVYVSRDENLAAVTRTLRAQPRGEDFARIELRRLPARGWEAEPGLRDAQGRTHYDRVKEFYRTHEVADYDLNKFYDRANDRLTPAFYKGDRSMRESGFDPSNRFGPFSADITSHNPVCLNSLLYVYEADADRIMRELGRVREARVWERRARAPRARQPPDVGRARRALQRLQLRLAGGQALPVRDDPLPSVGGDCDEGAGGARRV